MIVPAITLTEGMLSEDASFKLHNLFLDGCKRRKRDAKLVASWLHIYREWFSLPLMKSKNKKTHDVYVRALVNGCAQPRHIHVSAGCARRQKAKSEGGKNMSSEDGIAATS